MTQTGGAALARILAYATAGVEPEELFIAPVFAVRKVVEKAGLELSDIDLFEINEAFAAQMVACVRELNLPPDIVKVHGGAIALGHPLGASGGKLMATLLNELERTGGRYGLQTMCEGGGMANATIIERLGG